MSSKVTVKFNFVVFWLWVNPNKIQRCRKRVVRKYSNIVANSAPNAATQCGVVFGDKWSRDFEYPISKSEVRGKCILTSGVTRGFIQRGNLVGVIPLATVPTWQHFEKFGKWKCIRLWISKLKPEITGKHPEKIPKNAKNNNPLKTKRILIAQI